MTNTLHYNHYNFIYNKHSNTICDYFGQGASNNSSNFMWMQNLSRCLTLGEITPVGVVRWFLGAFYYSKPVTVGPNYTNTTTTNLWYGQQCTLNWGWQLKKVESLGTTDLDYPSSSFKMHQNVSFNGWSLLNFMKIGLIFIFSVSSSSEVVFTCVALSVSLFFCWQNKKKK